MGWKRLVLSDAKFGGSGKPRLWGRLARGAEKQVVEVDRNALVEMCRDPRGVVIACSVGTMRRVYGDRDVSSLR